MDSYEIITNSVRAEQSKGRLCENSQYCPSSAIVEAELAKSPTGWFGGKDEPTAADVSSTPQSPPETIPA